ncbi:type IV pilus assembly protein PilW [Neisseria canis]|uniref:Type IV pilus assembly protein PilW n=2 Tax=Neisseria canis TaxID=493 RepID=A0A3S4P5Y2_9NEIS|nr:type IV pilus assembly protein PilW [Neisseria canis]
MIAVGSGYFAARKVNDVAIARLNAQQDIRNVSNMIVYDARMAGSFGCFNLSNLDNKNIKISPDWTKYNDKDIHKLQNFLFAGTKGSADAIELSEGVKSIARADFASVMKISGFTAQSDALVFQYGDGSPAITEVTSNHVTIEPNGDVTAATLVNNSPVAVSTCDTLGLYLIDRADNNSKIINIRTNTQGSLDSSITDPKFKHQVSLTRYIINVYVVGRPNGGDQGLYRIQLGANNEWQTPQLLLPGINDMSILYGYAENCQGVNPDIDTEAKPASVPETFRFTKQQLTSDMVRPLASIRLVLNGNNLVAEGQTMQNAASRENAGNVYIHNIDANIRGGNRCANR